MIDRVGERPRALLRRLTVFIPILAIGAALRWYQIGRQSLWLDEIWEADTARHPLGHGFFEAVRAQTAAAPLDYLGVKATVKVLGYGTVEPRVWAFAMGVLAIAAIAWVAFEIFHSRRIALMAAALLALSAYHVSFSQEARPYALYLLFAVLIVGTFHRAAGSDRARDWALFAVAVAGGLYTHYFLVFVVAACAISLLTVAVADTATAHWRRAVIVAWLYRGAAFAGAAACAAIAFVPWFLYAGAGQLIGVNHGYPAPASLTLERLDETLLSMLAVAGGGTVWHPLAFAMARVVEALAVLGLVTWRPWRSPGVMALGLLATLAIPVAYMADAGSGYFFSTRQVIVVLVPFYLLAAAGGASMARWIAHRIRMGPWARAAVVAAVGLVLALGAWPGLAATYSTGYKPDWRGASNYIASHLCAAARIYVSYGDFGLRYYHPELLPRTTVWTGPVVPVEGIRTLPLHRGDWVAMYLPTVYPGTEKRIAAYLISRGYERTVFNRIDVFRVPLPCETDALRRF